MKTTKADLVAKVATATNLTKDLAGECVNEFLRALQEAILRNKGVVLKGLGTFELHEAPPRQYRNPVTGGSMQVPARQKVRFRASKPLLDAANR